MATQRLPPMDIEAEMSVLGAMILGDRRAVDKATEVLTRHDFYRDGHGKVFEAMKRMHETDRPVDIVSLKDELERSGALDAVGGISYLIQLGEFVPTTANVAYYARIVSRKARARRLIETCGELAGMAYAGQTENDEDIPFETLLLDQIGPLMDRKVTAGHLVPINDVFNNLMDTWELNSLGEGQERLGIKSNLAPLDWYLRGFRPGKLIIIAGRPGMGKTTLAFNICSGFAKNGHLSYFYTQEMDSEEVATDMIVSISGVVQERLEEFRLSDEEATAVRDAMDTMFGKVVFRDHTVSPVRIREDLRRAEVKPQAVFVDYLQLMKKEGIAGDREHERLTEIARELKEIAKEFAIPVIVLAQLNKDNERRDDKRPTLSDIGGADAIAAAADTVIGLYRVSYYERKEQLTEANVDTPYRPDEVECIILKNRRARTGVAVLDMVPGYSRFQEQKGPRL